MADAYMSRRRFFALTSSIATSAFLAGCGSQPVDNSHIRVGVMGPYTGDVAQYGLAVRSGALLYIKKFNEQGILNGKVIEAIAEDEKGDSTEAILVYNKLIDEGVTAIIGDVTSTPTIALAQKSVWIPYLV